MHEIIASLVFWQMIATVVLEDIQIQRVNSISVTTRLEELHLNITKPPKNLEIEEWVKWRKDIEAFTHMVWNSFPVPDMNFDNVSDTVLEMRSIDERIDESLENPNLFAIHKRREEMKRLLFDFYQNTLRLVTTYQVLKTIESVPKISRLEDWSDDGLKTFLSNTYAKFRDLRNEINNLKNDRHQWKLWSMDKIEEAVNQLAKSEGYSGFLIKSFMSAKQENDLRFFGQWAPSLYMSGQIMKRFLINSDHLEFEFHMSQKKKPSKQWRVKSMDENESKFQFLVLVITIIHFWQLFSNINAFL